MRFSQKELEKGKELLSRGGVHSIVFSGGTYQVEVLDGDLVLWPFLQIGDDGDILDGFCSCLENSERCFHLAAAYLSIFQASSLPLHVRWRRSFWNAICQIASEYHGYRADTLEKQVKGWGSRRIDHRRIFFIHPLQQEVAHTLEQMLEKRKIETEETSLKFSNLDETELQNWREGHPSKALQYELSFWSDLAKWFFTLQEEGVSYQITFHPHTTLPSWVKISCPLFEAGFYIGKEGWPALIPSLATISSDLSLYGSKKQKIRAIEYSIEKKMFFLYFFDTREESLPTLPHREVGDWDFVAGKGFYKKSEDPLLAATCIATDKVAVFLSRHMDLIKEYTKIPIHDAIHLLRYDLFFDNEGSLHICAYLLEKGDLCQSSSAVFSTWVYIEGKGFFYVQSALFSAAETIIHKSEVGDFIKRYQSWLGTVEGFHVHLANIASRLSYEVDQNKDLIFYAHIDLDEEEKDVVDLGEWVFLPGRGFFPKKTEGEETDIFAGKKVRGLEVAPFIRRHQRELWYVPDFFAFSSPIESVSWNICKDPKGMRIEPIYIKTPSAEKEQILFFEEYTYVAGEGFSRIPGAPPYLEKYLQATTLEGKEALYVLEHLGEWKPWIRSVDPALSYPKQMQLITQKADFQLGHTWEVELFYQTEMGRLSLHSLWTAIEEGKKHLFSPAGVIDLSEERFSWIRSLTKTKWKQKGKSLVLGSIEWARIVAQAEMPFSWQTEKAVETPSLEGLHSELRPYQQTGLLWLWFLYRFGLSGILCDEMGLGKTHQAMALLAAVRNSSPQEKYKFLVVCPTSVIYHWQELLRKYLPSMTTYVFYGSTRQAEKLQGDHDVVITSYGMVRSEKKHLQEIHFTVAIYDELQQAKNPKSQIHRALSSLHVHMAVGLTGTPVENRILDIKSLFDLVLPTYFPSQAYFDTHFMVPIEREKDEEARQRLARMLRPFVLRRKKRDVLLELPEKEEEIAYADLSPLQLQLYKEAFFSSRKEIAQDIHKMEGSKAQIHIFALFSKLKQICDHPCLVLENTDKFFQYASGKWDLFVELVSEARDSGQKIVVFTQYLKMMDIIEKYLSQEGIEYAEIRGSTRNRAEEIRRFQQDPQCEVFIGSLQAAGVGIDLTAGSVVIHYDRWWNPAKENQATDRVHRIGQSRGVQVFKLVTKHTIEERIHNLIEQKKGLLEEIVGFDEQDAIKSFSKQELLLLFQELEKDLGSDK